MAKKNASSPLVSSNPRSPRIYMGGALLAAASDRGLGVIPRLPRNRRKFPHLLVVGAGNSSDLGPAGSR